MTRLSLPTTREALLHGIHCPGRDPPPTRAGDQRGRLPPVPRRDPPQIDDPVVELRLHALLERDVAQEPPRLRRLLDDRRRLVVADVLVERGGDGQRRLRRALRALLV